VLRGSRGASGEPRGIAPGRPRRGRRADSASRRAGRSG